MKTITNTLKSIWKDEAAQGTAEYVLLIIVVATLGFIFKDRIKGMLKGRLDNIDSNMGSFNVETQ